VIAKTSSKGAEELLRLGVDSENSRPAAHSSARALSQRIILQRGREDSEGEGNRRLIPSLSNLTLKLIRSPTGATHLLPCTSFTDRYLLPRTNWPDHKRL